MPSDDPRDDIPSAEGPEDYGLAEDAGRGTDIDLHVTTRQEKKAGAEATGTPPQRQPLQWLDMSNWDSEPVPQRKWAIKDRVPLNQAGLFSGEGGTGKSIIELMKNVAHVTGKDWLDARTWPRNYLGAEDDKDEIHIQCEGYGRAPGVGDYPMAAVRNREPQVCDGVDFNVFNP